MSGAKAMRTARSVRPRSSRRHGAGGTLLGIFIGLIIGLGMAAAVAYWLMKNNPAFDRHASSPSAREIAKDASRVAKNDAAADKPRFDFYKILPGGEEPKAPPERRAERPDRALVDQAKERTTPKAAERTAESAPQDRMASVESAPRASRSGERFWLQAGSFSSESEAENLKARLAFAGWEATVQTGMTPDKAMRYRVRVGPYDNQDEMQRIKTEMGRRGFDAAVIKY
jgi:cell division protein FtsN